MNVVQYQTTIRKLLLLPNRRKTNPKKPTTKVTTKPTYTKGVYIFSKDERSDVHKIGLARGNGGLYERLMSYKLCFPHEDEFYIKFLIIGTTITDSEKLEKLVLASKKLKEIEPTITLEGKKSLEYRITSSRTVLNQEIAKVLKANLNLWTHVVVFGPSGWRIIRHDDSPLVLKLTKPSKTREEKPGLFEKKIVKHFDYEDGLPNKKSVKSKKTVKVKKVTVKPKKKKPKKKTYTSQYDIDAAIAASLGLPPPKYT